MIEWIRLEIMNRIRATAAFLLGRRLSVAEKDARRWKNEAAKLVRDMSRASDRLEKTTEKAKSLIDKESDRSARLYERAEALVERYEKAEETLTAELRIYKDVVIPTWSLNLESLRAQSEADIALQAQRKAAYSMSSTRKSGEEQ